MLRPVARAILDPLGLDFDEATGAPRQLSLIQPVLPSPPYAK